MRDNAGQGMAGGEERKFQEHIGIDLKWHTEPDGAFPVGGVDGHRLKELIVAGQDSARLGQQREPWTGGTYAGAASLEELEPELPFDGVDRLRQCWVADMQSTRRGRKPTL